ncbi:hypothetical protein PMAYCL1PPCAC_16568, partial [Pristionchus mayeri]
VNNLTNKRTFVALSNVLTRMLARATAKYPVGTYKDLPNPKGGEHGKCGLLQAGSLCDPDFIFDEEEKLVLLANLAYFEYQTRNSPVSSSHNSSDFCRDRGYSMGVAVMRNVEGASQLKLTEMAHGMLDTWKLDAQCGKHIVCAIAIDDGLFAATSPKDSLVRMDKFAKYFEDNASLFARAEVRIALRDIITRALDDANAGALFRPFNRKKRYVSRTL